MAGADDGDDEVLWDEPELVWQGPFPLDLGPVKLQAGRQKEYDRLTAFEAYDWVSRAGAKG
eukprot:425595-Alexandrium_andersonii.AAC.1